MTDETVVDEAPVDEPIVALPLPTEPQPAAPDPEDVSDTRPNVVLWAAKDDAYGVNIVTFNGGGPALFAAAAKLCDRLATVGMAVQERRPRGPKFGNGREDDFVLVFWFSYDGEVEIDDHWAEQFRPAQLWTAAKILDTRFGYLVQKEWAGEDIAQDRSRRAVAEPQKPSILVPGRPN